MRPSNKKPDWLVKSRAQSKINVSASLAAAGSKLKVAAASKGGGGLTLSRALRQASDATTPKEDGDEDEPQTASDRPPPAHPLDSPARRRLVEPASLESHLVCSWSRPEHGGG